MMSNFKIDESGTKREYSVENIKLAYTAREWLENHCRYIVSLLKKHGHPDAVGDRYRDWRFHKIDEMNDESITIRLHCFCGDSDETELITIPLGCIETDGFGIQEFCEKAKIDKAEKLAIEKERCRKAREADERRQLEELQKKYGHLEVLQQKCDQLP
jgi:hypothetical protein